MLPASQHPETADPVHSPREWLENNLPLVRGVVANVIRRQRCGAIEGDELLSLVCARLVQDDYRALRQFRGDSSIQTYLAALTSRLLLDDRIARWGKWRPSARAKALGPEAIALERSIVRDGIPPEEAMRRLAQSTDSDQVSLSMSVALAQARSRRRFVAADDALGLADPGPDPLARLSSQASWRLRTALMASVAKAIKGLSSRERLLLRLRHRDGLRVTEIALRLGESCKPLYRDLTRIHHRLRKTLELIGFRRDQVRVALDAIEPEPPSC